MCFYRCASFSASFGQAVGVICVLVQKLIRVGSIAALSWDSSLLHNILIIESAETYDGVYSWLYLVVCLSYEKFLTYAKGLLKTVIIAKVPLCTSMNMVIPKLRNCQTYVEPK